MNEHFDDAHRTLEQRALRNVRGLVDKLEAEERSRNTVAAKWAIALVLVIVAAGVIVALTVGMDSSPREIVIAPGQSVASNAPPPSGPPEVPGLRRAFVGSDKEARFASYVQQYSRKIESFGKSNYPREARGVDATVQVTAAIRSDGSVQSVQVNKSSGNPALDAAASRLVTSAQPFDEFSVHSLYDLDILHITKTFTFTKGTTANQGKSK
jgi:TonB family protein